MDQMTYACTSVQGYYEIQKNAMFASWSIRMILLIKMHHIRSICANESSRTLAAQCLQ